VRTVDLSRFGRRPAVAIAAVLVLGACGSPAGTPLPTTAPAVTPSRPVIGTPSVSTAPSASAGGATVGPEHVVVAIFENKGVEQIVGSGRAPAFDALAARGVFYTRSYAVAHPSQPNYLALFSGSTQGVPDDSCPHTFPTASSLARQLLDTGRTFTGYAEDLPSSTFTGCSHGSYARKHAPWVNFADLPHTVAQPYAAFPGDFAALPSVAFVVPNLCHDMHDCSIATGDVWLRDHLDAYATWAQSHHSLLIVTFDEDDSAGPNLIPTIIVGQGIAPARVATKIDHYTVLRTIEACFGLPALGIAASRTPLAHICP
jgi:phosphatidylinositol-3-phosphatase